MNLTLEQLKEILGSEKTASEWLEQLNTVLPKYDITTPKRIAAFLAQTSHESGGYRVLSENLNYSEAQLNKVFKKYFTSVSAADYAKQPEKIANYVYSNRMGNGPAESGDGWKFRGGGLIQLTGKDNFVKFAKKLGMTAEELIKFIRTPEGALVAACLFWNDKGCSALADNDDILGMTKKINGGTNGLEDRKRIYDLAIKVLTGKDDSKDPKDSVKLPVKIGDRNSVVKLVQKALNAPDDGVFGPTTLMEVKRFQRKASLPITGEVDAECLKLMLAKK